MPGGNRKGPLGSGPKTGRGLGYCAGYDEPGYTTAPDQGLGRGFRWGGRGRGGGRGRRNRFNADFWPGRGRAAFAVPGVPPEDDVESLKVQAQELQNALQEIQARLEKLEA